MKTAIATNQPGGKLILKVVKRFLFTLFFIGVLLYGLPGYKEYIEKVKYRLIPLIW